MTISNCSTTYTSPRGMLLPLTILFATACGVGLPATSSESDTDGGASGDPDGDGSSGAGSSGAGSSGVGSGGSGSESGTADTGLRVDTGSGSSSDSESSSSESSSSGSSSSESDSSESDSSESSGSESDSSESDSSESDSSESGEPLALGPARVDLGFESDLAAPASYAILAKTGITNVTGSSISGGNLGVSPAAATFITGFSLTADPTTTYSTSPSVVAPAVVFASNYAEPTPAYLSTAVLGMEAAYTDAAGRADPDYLNLDGGEIGGLTLSPGLYTWGSSVTIPEDVTLEGGENDVWILQISNDLDQSVATRVNLTEGAQASNVFWQVAGQVTIHADAHFEGVILTQTAVTLQTNATFTGRILAQTLVALDDNDVTTTGPLHNQGQ